MEEGQCLNGTRRSQPEDVGSPPRPSVDDEGATEEVQNGPRRDVERPQKLHTSSKSIYHRRQTDGDTVNSTRSLYEADAIYIIENGRRYCGNYYMPNDEEEQERLQITHQVYLHLFNKELTSIPLVNPTKILDIGTGTGDWAMEMGDMWPNAEVIGTDIAKVQPSAVPLNVFFEIDNAEEEGGWAWPVNSFDLIHFRNMSGAFADWQSMYRETFTHLKPGGWVEVLDFDDNKNFLNFFSENSELHKFTAAIAEASNRSGRPRGVQHLDPQRLTDMGFVDIQTRDYEIPVGAWPETQEEQSLGKFWLIACCCSVEALSLRLLTQELDWSPDEVKRLCNLVAEEVKVVAMDPERARGLVVKVRVLAARKPEAPEDETNEKHDPPNKPNVP